MLAEWCFSPSASTAKVQCHSWRPVRVLTGKEPPTTRLNPHFRGESKKTKEEIKLRSFESNPAVLIDL